LSVLLAGSAFSAERPQQPFYSLFTPPPPARRLAQLGRHLFFDPNLSASGKTACASCHDPHRAYGPPGEAPVELAGRDGKQPGLRAVPSLMYAQNTPPFSLHFFDDDGDDSIDQGPVGGRTWDGRSQSTHDQARLPLLSTFEMANGSEKEVVERLAHGEEAGEMRGLFGAQIFAEPDRLFLALLLALETFQQEPSEFYPYSSKYDAYLRGTAQLDADEQRGLKLFNDPQKGNCARCHPSAMRHGALPQFTDFGYAAIGVPRNPKIPANENPEYFDLGLCGPLRSDLAAHPEYCGMFKTPTLRNVAVRRVFFHNGVRTDLKEAVRFYATRDTDPRAWYPLTARGVQKFDDLPKDKQGALDTLPPFDKHRGDVPSLSDTELNELVAFLRALTDGYSAPTPKPVQ
jgi:cytochrome c peroxidase